MVTFKQSGYQGKRSSTVSYDKHGFHVCLKVK
jgi:hypothetical protein